MTEVAQISNPSQNRFDIIKTGEISVTRSGSSDNGSADIGAPLGGTAFTCYAYSPIASPQFIYALPNISYFTGGANSGKIIGGLRALYDPSVGNIRFFIDSTDINPGYASDETWTFRYFIFSNKTA